MAHIKTNSGNDLVLGKDRQGSSNHAVNIYLPPCSIYCVSSMLGSFIHNALSLHSLQLAIPTERNSFPQKFQQSLGWVSLEQLRSHAYTRTNHCDRGRDSTDWSSLVTWSSLKSEGVSLNPQTLVYLSKMERWLSKGKQKFYYQNRKESGQDDTVNTITSHIVVHYYSRFCFL